MVFATRSLVSGMLVTQANARGTDIVASSQHPYTSLIQDSEANLNSPDIKLRPQNDRLACPSVAN